MFWFPFLQCLWPLLTELHKCGYNLQIIFPMHNFQCVRVCLTVTLLVALQSDGTTQSVTNKKVLMCYECYVGSAIGNTQCTFRDMWNKTTTRWERENLEQCHNISTFILSSISFNCLGFNCIIIWWRGHTFQISGVKGSSATIEFAG